jgi:proteasome lid subunit RPN8/RPN11
MHTLTLTQLQMQSIIDHVEAHAPLEACGLLAGRESRVERIWTVPNQAESPVRYVMEPVAQLKALEWIDSNGMDLLGIFHSHPAGPETPSPTDIAEAAYPAVQVILARSAGRWSARGFWIEGASFDAVELRIE